MSVRQWCLVVVGSAVLASPLAAQDRDYRAELGGRGAPAAFVNAVAVQVEAAQAAGVPTGPVIDKAFEGWAKRVPEQRVVTALEQVRMRLVSGRALSVAAGYAPPPEAMVAGAGEALARGLTQDDVRALIAGAPGPEAAAAGLTVAASMHAQGLERAAAVRAVQDAYGRDLDPARLFELPSVVADLTGHGMQMGDLARRIMQGGGLPLPPMAGTGQGAGRPGQVPPGPGGQQQGTGKQQRRQ
jgi:hypothetical protein